MAIGPRLDLRTSQSLVISPQLQAAIKLLALSNLDLQAEISNELERNPLLEVADDGQGDGGTIEALGADSAEAPGAGERIETPAMDETFSSDLGAPAADLDVDLTEERFHHDSAPDRPGDGGEDFSFDQFAAADATLADVLEQQVLRLKPADQPVALHLVSLLDECGYLTEPLDLVAARLGISLSEAERVLRLVQTFEPTGVGARTLAECIALQAKEADRYDPCMAALIDNLDLVAKGDLNQLRRLCNVDAEDMADMLHELRSYDPKPGLAHGGGSAPPVVPDIFVRRTAKGWTVELNSGTLPRLIVNRQYQARVASQMEANGQGKRRPERQFLDQCASQANWLMRALDQRAATIMKVAAALVEEQRGFFEHGVQHLRPLTLRTIADIIGMHESTVSRVTSNKYLSCDRGVFELKYFFTSAIQSVSGADASAEAVRQRLKALVDNEPPLKPLSDDKLVELLKAEGFDLARRTVAKYREAMNIPSSFDRRRRAVVRAA